MTGLAALCAVASMSAQGAVVIDFGSNSPDLPGVGSFTPAAFSAMMDGTTEASAYTTGTFSALPSGNPGSGVSFDVVVNASANVRAQDGGLGVDSGVAALAIDNNNDNGPLEWVSFQLTNVSGLGEGDQLVIKSVLLDFLDAAGESYRLDIGTSGIAPNAESEVVVGEAVNGSNDFFAIDNAQFTMGAGSVGAGTTGTRFVIQSITVDVRKVERTKGWYGEIPVAPGDEKFQRIYVENGTLYHEDGSEVALWGVNFQSAMSGELGNRTTLMSSWNFDIDVWKSIVDKGFDEIQQMGCDIIRIHLCPGDFADEQGNLVETVWLDMVDYTMAECFKRGIYINFALQNHLQQWGGVVTPTFLGRDDEERKWELISVPEMIAASTNYITQLVNRPNPYDNNRPYKHNPAWIVCEMINEPLFPNAKPNAAKYPEGVAVYEQWLVDRSKPDNTTSWNQFKYEKIKDYINLTDAVLLNEKVPAVSCWNLFWSRGPLDQGWEGYNAAADSTVDIVSFSTYTGRADSAVGADLRSNNYLPYLKTSYDLTDWQGWPYKRSGFKGQKATIVYEYETLHNQSTYLYPAMAKYFRGLGAQTASMWTYYLSHDPELMGLTKYHNLNMVATPRKAASFLVAREVFKNTPRYQTYRTTKSDADQFANAALSFPLDLSAYSTDDLFIHTGDVDGSFIDIPAAPSRIVGYGDSPFVNYAGMGVYFLDVAEQGKWTLKVMPNAEMFDDFVTIDETTSQSMSLQLPGVTASFELYRVVDGVEAFFGAFQSGETFSIVPGDYSIVPESWMAGAIEFTSDEGYRNGELVGQQTWKGDVGNFSVNTDDPGTMTVGAGAWNRAEYGPALEGDTGAVFTLGVAFSFSEMAASSDKRNAFRVQFTGPGSEAAALTLARLANGDYQVGFYENSGAASWHNGIPLTMASIGTTNGPGSASDALYMEMALTKGTTESNWTARATFYNLTNDPDQAYPPLDTFTFGFAVSAGFHANALLPALNSAAQSAASITDVAVDSVLIKPVAAPFAKWIYKHNLSGADAELTADPDGDGLSNLAEYALGGNPTNANDASILPTFAKSLGGGSASWDYVYRRRTDDPGLTYWVETSTDLVSGGWRTDGSIELEPEVIDDEFESVTNRVDTAGKPKMFIRLRINKD